MYASTINSAVVIDSALLRHVDGISQRIPSFFSPDDLRDPGAWLIQQPQLTHLYWLSHRTESIQQAVALTSQCRSRGITVVPIGFADQVEQIVPLERAGAWFIARDVDEIAAFVTTPRSAHSLSIVLLAFNEEALIASAILEAQRFGQIYVSDYEVIVVDDGSTDKTNEIVSALVGVDVGLVTHRHNAGMGASIRDGLAAAHKDFVTSLPADRQVRPQAFLPMLSLLTPSRVALSQYIVPHSGVTRAVLSTVFRWIVQYGGGLRVDFAGCYIVPRPWLSRVAFLSLRSNTYMYSFELLSALAKAGCDIAPAVYIRPFRREVGQSREFHWKRMLKVLREVAKIRGVPI